MIIYCIENTINGKCYIGQTIQTFERRKSAHLFDLRSGKHNNKLQSDWDEYGQEAFRWYILEDNIYDVDVLTERENKWINKLETYKDDKGYNIACQSYTNVLTDNSRRKQTGAYRIPVVKYSLTGEKLCEYNTITQASNDVGVSLNTMTVCLQGETGKCGGFQWRYANDYPPDKIEAYEQYAPPTKKVARYTLEGEFIDIFDSTEQTAKELDRHVHSIRRACRGKGVVCAGYQFRYYEDEPLEKIKHTESHGRKCNRSRMKEVIKCDLEGNELETYKDLYEAADSVDGYFGTIGTICSGNYYKDTLYGYKWKYKK